MTQLDPKKFNVTSHTEEDSTFQDMLAEQLTRSPWLVLSAALHGLALLILWVLVPAEVKKAAPRHTEVVDTTKELVQPIEPPKPIEPVPEDKEVDPILTDIPLDPTDDPVDVELPDDPRDTFEINDITSSPTIGLTGGPPGPYGRRGGPPSGGGRGSTYPQIEYALKWLARHQDADGKWDCDQFMKHDVTTGAICDGAGNAVHDVGVTGLALLAFLGNNHTMRSGDYREHVKRGVLWLRDQQQESGLFGTATSHDFVYDHAIAAYAMCEAFGLSRYTLLEPTAQRAINYLESHRNPYSVWRYQPRDNDNDTSVTGWCVMAYKSGEYFGLKVNKTALDLCATWLDQVADPTGRHGYQKIGEASSRKHGDHEVRFPAALGESMTAVGLFCRYFIGQDPKEKPVMDAAAELILSKPPVWDTGSGAIDHYYWYYATYALFQVGGRPWQQWQKHLGKAVVKTQHTEDSGPNLKGSWDPVGAWGEDGGRVYSTAILALTLQAHYRYTPFLR